MLVPLVLAAWPGCPKAYHIRCVKLPAIPTGAWYCSECKLAHSRTSGPKARGVKGKADGPSHRVGDAGAAAAGVSPPDVEPYFDVDVSALASVTDGAPASDPDDFSLVQLMQQLELLVPHSTIVGAAALVRRFLTQRRYAEKLLSDGGGGDSGGGDGVWNPWGNSLERPGSEGMSPLLPGVCVCPIVTFVDLALRAWMRARN